LIAIDLGREVNVEPSRCATPFRRPGTQLVTRAASPSTEVATSMSRCRQNAGSEPMRVALDGKPFHQLEITVLDAVGDNDGSAGFSEIEIPGVRRRRVDRAADRRSSICSVERDHRTAGVHAEP
jgi:hypothetical protein